MYPDLSYFLHHLIGTNPDNAFSIIKTFGLLLVIAILTAAFMLYQEFKRKEKLGWLTPSKIKITEGAPASPTELITNALLGFVLGFKILYIIQHFADFKIDPAEVILSTKGNWVGGVIGAILLAGLKYWEKKRMERTPPVEKTITVWPHDRIGDITIVAAISGIVGSKLFALAEDVDRLTQGEITIGDLINSFFSGSGMAIYGGLIIGFFTLWIYLRSKKINFVHFLDSVAPAVMIAYGIGRLGCHFSGDGDWGIINEMTRPDALAWLPDWLWAYDYPNNVIDSRQYHPITGELMREQIEQIADCDWRYCTKLASPVWPTSVYEFLMASGLGGILWGLRKKIIIPGLLFFIYLIFNGFERFWIEKIRVNENYQVFGINTTQAEFIAVILMMIGVIGALVTWYRYKQGKPLA